MLLIIAGLDPTAKAGILKDASIAASLKTAYCGCLTTNTVQTKKSFTNQSPTDPIFFKEQLHALLEAESFSAVKIGFLSSLANAEIVASLLSQFKAPNIVVDPVIVGKRLKKVLVDQELVEFYSSTLFPMASIITPNLTEAQTLSNIEEPESISQKMADEYSSQVIISGIMKGSKVSDCLASPGNSSVRWFHRNKSEDPEKLVGRGCELSTRLACHLALGVSIESAL